MILLSRTDNPAKDPERLSAVCGTQGVRLLMQFGSTVSNHVDAASDIDLAALLERRPPQAMNLDTCRRETAS